MSWDAVQDSEIQVGNPISQTLMQKIKDNLDYLYGQTSTTAGGLPNGSFEIDSDDSGVPDGWTFSTYSGGTVALDETTAAHGARGVQITHPGGTGNGGGYVESDYVECGEGSGIFVSWYHRASNAAMRNTVVLRFFDDEKLDLSADETVYDSTDNPTATVRFLRSAIPPATARFYKLRLTAGETSVDEAGTAYYDGVNVSPNDPGGGRSDFTLTEDTSTASSWTDVDSAQIPVPYAGDFLTFSVGLTVEGRQADTGTLFLRCRVGTAYSNEVSITGTSWLTRTLRIPSVPASEITDGEITIVLQAYRNTGTLHFRKTDGRCFIRHGG